MKKMAQAKTKTVMSRRFWIHPSAMAVHIPPVATIASPHVGEVCSTIT